MKLTKLCKHTTKLYFHFVREYKKITIKIYFRSTCVIIQSDVSVVKMGVVTQNQEVPIAAALLEQWETPSP